MSPTTSSLYSSVTEIAPCVKLYDDVWPGSTAFIEQLESGTETSFIRWGAGTLNTDKGPLVDTKYRNVQIIGIPSFEGFPPKEDADPSVFKMYDMYNELVSKFDPIIEEYRSEYGVPTETKEGIQLLKYGVDQFFAAHVDDSPRRPRRISYVYYVNDDYEGGEIEFTNFKVTVKPKAHQLLVFPSSYAYRHAVHPVTAGTRYAMVQWWN
jgi:hypothetical protein